MSESLGSFLDLFPFWLELCLGYNWRPRRMDWTFSLKRIVSLAPVAPPPWRTSFITSWCINIHPDRDGVSTATQDRHSSIGPLTCAVIIPLWREGSHLRSSEWIWNNIFRNLFSQETQESWTCVKCVNYLQFGLILCRFHIHHHCYEQVLHNSRSN